MLQQRNNLIHAGPKLQNDLFDVLIRFRRNAVALQIKLRSDDFKYL